MGPITPELMLLF